MAKLQKTFFGSGNYPPRNEGTATPSWLNNENDTGSWYTSEDTADGEIRYHYNIVDENKIYVQYGKNQSGWASARFFAQSLEIINEVENEDNSITAEVEVQSLFFKAVPNDFAIAGFSVEYELLVNKNLQYEYTGNSIDAFDFGSKTIQTINVQVDPQQTSTETAFEWRTTYRDGEAEDSTIFIGFGLFNPNAIPPKVYVPMAIRKSNDWKSLNENDGFIEKRVSNSWEDYSEELVPDSMKENKGKNRIRRNGKWLQLPKM